jgi:nucleotide-binding universal stress UspA family protein
MAARVRDAGGKGLKQNAIGYLSNVVIGVASTGPGYSIAATLGFVVAVEGVGLQAPAVARAALEEAIRLCQDLSVALTVVFGWNVTPEREVADLRHAIHQIGERETSAAVARAQDAGLTAEARVETERAAEAIVRIAEEKDARMVVVGSHGERPIKGVLVGSTPHRLVHLSNTPVLVVRG